MLKNVNNYQYLFLGGILGEILTLPFVGNYLRENKTLLVDSGVETQNIHFMTMNSFVDASRNGKKLAQIILELYKKNNKKIVIFAHSKACLESTLSLANHFEDIESCVQQLICFSPPFKGSTLFTKRNNHWFDKVTYGLLKGAKKVIAGVECLEPNFYSDELSRKINSNPKLQLFVKNNLLVVKGYKSDNNDVAWIIKPTHHILQLAGEDNDGLVTLANQEIPNVEYQSITLNMDHSDLFTSSLLSNRGDDYRLILMNSFIDYSINSVSVSSLLQQLSVGPSGYANRNLQPHRR